MSFIYTVAVYLWLQDGMTPEIMALAQGHNDIAELLIKLKPVSRNSFIYCVLFMIMKL